MARELILFLGAAIVLALPGVLLATIFGLGGRFLDRCTHGCCIGFALAICLGSICSEFNLRLFFPLWIGIGLLVLIFTLVRGAKPIIPVRSIELWTIAVIVVVAATRFAVALPRITPPTGDPAVFLVLAEKIQIAQHAAADWQPFDAASVTYPAGGAVLIALMSSISRLPLYTIYKDLQPLLGVLATAQIALFTRRLTKDDRAPLFAAFAFGMWAGVGSIDLLTGGGFAIELGMLLLVAALSAWLEDAHRFVRAAATCLFYAAMILSHHHTQLAGSAVVGVIFIWMIFRPATRREAQWLAISVLAAAILDGFFLVPFAAKIVSLKQTNALYSEPPAHLLWFIRRMGYAYLLAAAVGIIFWLGHRDRCHPAAFLSVLAVVGVFVLCEYILPQFVPARDKHHWTPFSPSHFLADLMFFLAPFAGIAISRVRLPNFAVLIAMLLIAASQRQIWRDLAEADDVGRDYVQACQWIRGNTSADSFVLEGDWGMYFSWRRGPRFRLPDSEQRDQRQSIADHIAFIVAGKTPPDSPQMEIVRIDQDGSSKLPVLWRSPSGLAVVRAFPK